MLSGIYRSGIHDPNSLNLAVTNFMTHAKIPKFGTIASFCLVSYSGVREEMLQKSL